MSELREKAIEEVAKMLNRPASEMLGEFAFTTLYTSTLVDLVRDKLLAEQQRDQARELLRQSEAQLYRLQALTRSPQSFDMEIVNTDAEWLQRRIREFLAPPAAKEETGK